MSLKLRVAAICTVLLSLVIVAPCSASGPPPVINVQPLSQTVLFNGSVTFTVSATSGTSMSYQWSKNGLPILGATQSSYTITNAQTTDAGTYAVKITNGGGSVTSSNATLTVLTAPLIITHPTSQTVIQGQNASFSVVVVGAPPLIYQWSFNGVALPWATNPSLTVTNAQTSDAGSYRVVVTNLWGSAASATATLTVLVPPGISSQPQSQTVTAGQNASFSVAATGTVPLSYQWSFNGSVMGAATNAVLTLTNAQPANEGNYTVVVTNAAGAVTSAVATLTINVPAGITGQPQDQAVAATQNAAFTVTATGTGPLNYQWSFNGTPIPGATNNVYTVTNAQNTNAGVYCAAVWNTTGWASSRNASLTVGGPPVGSSGDAVCVNATSVSTFGWQHTISSGPNCALVVGIALAGNSGGVSSVTYGGTPLTRLASGQTGSTVEMWCLLTPPPGSATIVATWTAAKDMVGWSGSFTNVDQANPVRSFAVTNGNNSTPSVTVSAAPGDLVVDTVSDTGNATSLTVGSGQTQICQNTTGNGGSCSLAGASYRASTPSVTMSWLAGAAKNWGMAAVTLKAATLTAASQSAPGLSALGMTANGFQFQLSGTAGFTCVIWASSDLQSWSPIATNAAVSGNVVVTDPDAANYAWRFYRATAQ